MVLLMGMWLVSFGAIVLWTRLAMISHTQERVSNLKWVGDCWGVSYWNLGENAKLFPKVMRPIYTSTSNEGEETIFRVLGYMPGTMGRKEEKHSESEQVLRQILSVLIQIPRDPLILSTHLSPVQGFALRPPSLALTGACLVVVCPQAKPGRLGSLSPPHTFLWPILTLSHWLVGIYSGCCLQSWQTYTQRVPIGSGWSHLPGTLPEPTHFLFSCLPCPASLTSFQFLLRALP